MAGMHGSMPVGPAACTNIMDAALLVKRNLFHDREVVDLATQLNIASICMYNLDLY